MSAQWDRAVNERLSVSVAAVPRNSRTAKKDESCSFSFACATSCEETGRPRHEESGSDKELFCLCWAV